MTCPCGSGGPEARCCGPFLAGAPAPTPEALMRSRYTAYARKAVDYVVATQQGADRAAIARWAAEATFEGLAVQRASGDVVEFVAVGTARGAPFVLHERSRFARVYGRWLYLAGDELEVPRNEPCPCGSGKKLKRCHFTR